MKESLYCKQLAANGEGVTLLAQPKATFALTGARGCDKIRMLSRLLRAQWVAKALSDLGGIMSARFPVRGKSILLAILVSFLLPTGAALASPSITLSKRTGPPTSRILVSGRGFAANVGVDIYFDTEDKALVVTNNKGGFNKTAIRVPLEASPGKHWITALERNNDKGAQEPFSVFTDWPQFGFDASLSGFNPYENVLNKNNVAGLDVAWTYTSPTEYEFSNPAVWEDMVFAVEGGTLYAFDAETGTVLWTYGVGFAPPAVYKGVVYIQDGLRAEAFDARTGTLLWSYTMDVGAATSVPPSVANGRLFVASGDGPLYALNATTGKLIWQFRPSDGWYLEWGAAVGYGAVYIGWNDADGNDYTYLYALDEKDGSVLWQTQQAVTGSPTVEYGLVFINNSNYEAMALDASTGAVVWQTKQYFGGTPAVANGTVYVSDGAGLAALDAYTGEQLWQSSYGGVSPAVIANGVVYSGTGSAIDAIDAATGDLLWTYPIGHNYAYSPAVANGWVFVPAFEASGNLYTQLYAFRLKHGTTAEGLNSAERPSYSALQPDPKLKALNLSTGR